jgi:hypothetical protein
VREIRTLGATWRGLETDLRRLLNGHEKGNLGYKPRRNLRGTAPVLDPTAIWPEPLSVRASDGSGGAGNGCMGPWDSSMGTESRIRSHLRQPPHLDTPHNPCCELCRSA